MDYAKYQKLEFRRKFFKMFGAEIDITDPASGKLVGFIEVKAWRLKEDIRVYRDKTKTTELFRISARSVLDFGVTYDIHDSISGEQLFSMRRKGLKSAFVRDHWLLKNSSDKLIGELRETSSSLALVRRYVDLIPVVGWVIDIIMSFFPLTYVITDSDGQTSANITHHKNPIVVKFGLDTTDSPSPLDQRLNIAATALLSVVDANKN